MASRIRRPLLLTLAATLPLLVAAACGGHSESCPDSAECREESTPGITSITARTTIGPTTRPTPADTPASPSGAPPADVTASATPITPIPGPPTTVLPPTATLIPPDPSQVTPRPTDPPFTRTPRPRTPAEADIKLGSNGKYYADVDGCHWAEYGRFLDPLSGDEEIGMQTPCLPQEGLHYNPKTGEVRHFVA